MREDIGRGVRRDGDGWWRGGGVVCVRVYVVVRLGRKNGGDGGGIFNRGEGGAKRRRFSVEPPERLYVRSCVCVCTIQ